MKISKRFSCLFFLLILVCFLIQGQAVKAVEISGELANEFSYTRGERINQWGEKEDIDEFDNQPDLNLEVSGLLRDFKYRFDLRLDGAQFSPEVERATISTFLEPIFLEAGEKDWGWGEGFSFQPTSPFPDDEIYLGTEANLFYKGYDLDFGLTVNDDNDNLSTGWFKLGKLLTTSDYQLVVSYLDEDLESDKEQGVNLGVDYSKDFLNDLVLHSGLNLRYCLEDEQFNEQYLLGGTYYLERNWLMIGEYYRQDDDYLMLSLRDNDTSTDWEWDLGYTVNLSDFGQRRSLHLSYSGIDDFTPQFEVVNYGGADDSSLADKPEDWEVKFKVAVEVF